MRLVLSRKGYDSASGGHPSPIFPDGRICSLPIPSEDALQLQDVRFGEGSLGDIAAQLVGDPSRVTARTHLDPDLDAAARPRESGWRPCFGQTGAAQAHLENRGVGVGDLFLFFGWFREVEALKDRWRYRAGAPDIHCLFGWLQVGSICRLDDGDEAPTWASEHPHVGNADRYRSSRSRNTLYVASRFLELPALPGGLSGGGVFPLYSPTLRLTAAECSRSVWRLPDCFEPRPGTEPLSYHASAKRWSRDDEGILLRTAGRGQEFVLDCDEYPGVEEWLGRLFAPVRLRGTSPDLLTERLPDRAASARAETAGGERRAAELSEDVVANPRLRVDCSGATAALPRCAPLHGLAREPAARPDAGQQLTPAAPRICVGRAHRRCGGCLMS